MSSSAAYREHTNLLAVLIDFLRDVAILAAATGVAWWAWDHYCNAPARRDDAARLQLAAERRTADLKQWAERLDERTAGMAMHLEEMVAARRATEQRTAAQVRVHRLLQATTDPFLTFAEIERALGNVGRFAGALADDGEPPDKLEGDGLRRVLIELVGNGVITQLDRDRYFIASDFETGDEGDHDGPA